MTAEATIPQDVIDHCARHKLCPGCALVNGVCVAPMVPVTDPRWRAWLDRVVSEVREINGGRA